LYIAPAADPSCGPTVITIPDVDELGIEKPDCAPRSGVGG
jgi:hypothetical protein